MSTNDNGAATWTSGSSSEEGAPADSPKKSKITAISQETAVVSFEGRGRVSTNGDQDDQVDLKEIHDQVRLTNMDQFFPELVWGKVLGKLRKKTDIENCSNASSFFGGLLREKVVLPLVFDLLADHYYWSNWEKDESYKETNVESIPWQRPAKSKEPHWMTPIWKCRLVCRKWNKAIEEIYESENTRCYEMEHNFYKHAARKVLEAWTTADLSRESKIVNFLDHFKATHYDVVRRVSTKNPFLSRRLKFDHRSWENEQAYFNRFVEMIDKFGDQVGYFDFVWRCWESEAELVHSYRKFKTMLESMTNLKGLRIVYLGAASEEEQLALEEEIQRNPLPEGNKLEMISVKGIPGLLCNHLVNRNRQITSLKAVDIEFLGNCTIFTEKLPKLTQLSLVEVNFSEVFEAFERCPFTLNLEKCNLWLMAGLSFVPWSRVFSAIGSKLNSDICAELLLKMPRPTSDAERMSALQDSLLSRLQLGNIQRCKVSSDCRFSLDFLLESKNTLWEIQVELCCDPACEGAEQDELMDKQVIKFLGCEENMEQSNIAKELPQLRTLEVWLNYDTRRQYTIQPNGVMKS